MKKILILAGLYICTVASLYAVQPTIDKGNGIDGYSVSIDSFSTNTIISTSNSSQANNSDYLIKNDGSIDVYLDGVAAAASGYKLSAGEVVSVDGRVQANLYGRTAAAASTSTVYVLMSYTQ